MRKKSWSFKNDGFAVLPLTSMVDMFTILLVFLLSSFSTAEYDISPYKDMQLPETTSTHSTKKAPILVANKFLLLFEDKKISQLSLGEISKKDLDATDRKFIRPLFEALDEYLKEFDNMDEADRPNTLILQADALHKYTLIEQIMYTASLAGFSEIKIAGMAAQ